MGEMMRIRNPRTGVYDFEIEATDLAALPAIAQDLRARQPAWQALGLEGRLEALNEWNLEFQKRYDDILAALVQDTGRLVEAEKEMQRLPGSIKRLSVMAREVFADRRHNLRSMPDVEVRGDLSPFPLVGVIAPWNFPLSMSLMDTMPALVSGCAVIVKPSEITPRFVAPMVETIRKVPEVDAILRYVIGGRELGEAMVETVDAICFTGSVATGQKVAAAAGRAFIPAFLELGGKDPVIVTASAELDRAAAGVLAGSVANTGQVCVSLERVYVDEVVHDAFVEKLVEKSQAVRPAHPGFADGVLGPIILESQARIINDHLRDALDKGATIRCGGMVEQRDGGWWASPTVVTGVNHDMVLMRDETFGPIMPVMPYRDVEEALRLANDSEYGLGGAVFAGSTEEAVGIAGRMDVSSVSINATGLGTAAIGEGDDVEKNAFKRSGLSGSRLGYESLTRFMRKKAYLIKG